MTLPAVLGANLWMVAVAVPLALGLRGSVSPWPVVCAGAAPVVLAVATWRRSEAALLVAFPVTALLPQALLAGGDAGGFAMMSPPVWLAAASLFAYLWGTSRALSQAEPSAGGPPRVAHTFGRERVPERWLRRFRIYRGLGVVAAVFPIALMAWVNGRPETVLAIDRAFGSRAPFGRTFYTVAVGLLWLGLFHAYVLQTLHAHLHSDRTLMAELDQARAQAHLGRPRPAFYFFVVLALVAMGSAVWWRTR